MRLSELIEGLGPAPSGGRGDPEIADLAYSSRSVAAGTLFFCVPGFTSDGHDFAPAAIERGAVALVCERSLDLSVPQVIVPSVREAMAPAAARFFCRPTERLELLGITGTNGKTTTAFMLRALFEAAGRSTGLLGTVESIVGGAVEPVERTTPEAVDLQRTFARMLEAGDEACAMEVSSHALELHRADATRFACAVFTNLTQDHLDFHPTLEDYFQAKRRLFFPASAAGLGAPPGVAVVNIDDEHGRRLAGELEAAGRPAVTFALDREADFRATSPSYSAAGSRFVCQTPDGPLGLETRLPGLFNVLNATGAVAVARSLGLAPEVVRAGLAQVDRVPGRFEPVEEGQAFAVLVDYAHTPDSLENVLRAGRGLLAESGSNGRLHVVFGCGGDRDRGKRPRMGSIARRLADRVVVTSDNPRSDEPEAIVAEILVGAEQEEGSSELESEVDRRRAIALTLAGARAGDVVIVAGKGHEQGQEFADGRKIPFDDRTVAQEELRRLLLPA